MPISDTRPCDILKAGYIHPTPKTLLFLPDPSLPELAAMLINISLIYTAAAPSVKMEGM